MAEKTIKLLGVRHSPAYFEEVKEALEKHLKPGQTIGFEIAPSSLNQFEEIHKSGKDFSEAFKPVWMAWVREALAPKKVSDSFLERDYKERLPAKEFFYRLFVLCKQKNLEVKALESEYATLKSRAIDMSGIFSFIKKYKLRQLIRIPVRERFFVSRIIKLKPDFVVIGAGHLGEIKNKLRAQGINTKTIYFRKLVPGTVERRKLLRQEYLLQKEKSLAKRLRKLKRHRL